MIATPWAEFFFDFFFFPSIPHPYLPRAMPFAFAFLFPCPAYSPVWLPARHTIRVLRVAAADEE